MDYPENATEIFKVKKPARFTGFTGLYLASAFRGLGMNLISLFIPLYILKITGSVVTIFLFYAFYHFWVVASVYPVAILVRRFGVDLICFLGCLMRAFFIFFLLKAESQPFFLWWAAVAWGITVSFYWLPFHYSFTVAEKEDGKYGKEVSRLHIVYRITELIGPVAGGFLIASLGFKPLFSLVIVLMIISGLPLFFDTIQGKGMRLSFGKIVGHLVKKERFKFWLSLAGAELETTILGLAWPLFIYFAVKNYEALGIIKSGAALVSMVLIWFLGQWVDKKGKSILRLGTIINSFNILLRSFITSPFGLFLVDSAHKLTAELVSTPFGSAFYEKAFQMRKLEFMVEREFVLHFSGMVACLLVGLLFVLNVSWFWIFCLGAGGLMAKNYILDSNV